MTSCPGSLSSRDTIELGQLIRLCLCASLPLQVNHLGMPVDEGMQQRVTLQSLE